MSFRFDHKPVMLAEVLDALRPRPGGRYADGTVGGAGHAEAILAASSPNGWLFGCDLDGVAIKAAEELARIFWEFGGEPQARRLAREIVRERARCPFETTSRLAEVIERISPRHGKRTHPATKVFQALRIAVNDEIGSLRIGLAEALKILKPGGRLAVITFHSLEDRVVKDFGRARAQDYTFTGGVDVPELRQPRAPELELVKRKPIKPGAAELADNPRSRSAQLRVMEKL